jgi:hypothetical protein
MDYEAAKERRYAFTRPSALYLLISTNCKKVNKGGMNTFVDNPATLPMHDRYFRPLETGLRFTME